MKVVTAEEMRAIDSKTIKKYGMPSAVLMERAGLSVANKISELFDKKKVVVLAGGGNNGGDGIVAARTLHNQGWHVKVLIVSGENKLSPDCRAQYRTAKQSGIDLEFRKMITAKDLHGAVVLDALLGTGINKPVSSPLLEIIAFLNRSDVPVVSVDIPSGISSDNGQIMGEAVRADYTVTFGLPKIGHMLYPGAEYSGTLFIEDIGFPQELLGSDRLVVELIEKEYASLLMPERPKNSHKGDYGHVLVVAGSKGKTGAAVMCAKACLRTGAGLVTIGVPESLINVFQSRVTEEMVLPLPDKGNGTLSEKASDAILEFLTKRVDVFAIGPGLSLNRDIISLLTKLLLTVTVPMVLDADAINAIAGEIEILRKVKAPVILTPHAGEMARLLQITAPPSIPPSRGGMVREGVEMANSEIRTKIEQNRINTAISFAKKTGVYLVLKGVPTIIAEPEGRAFINPTGNPGMATAGTGDVLTGMIASLLGQGLNPLEASVLGVYIHGLAGDKASAKTGKHSLIASDIIKEIPSAFKALRN